MKIVECKNVGCLKDVTNEIDFGQRAFIYGLNGSGKSTIKDLFKKTFTEKSKLATTFGQKDKDCKAIVELMNKRAEYKKSKLEKPIDKIVLHVFDQEYIEKNIYVNGSITDENKAGYYRIFVGDNINEKINKLLEKHTNYLGIHRDYSTEVGVFSNIVKCLSNVIRLYDAAKKQLKTKIAVVSCQTTILGRISKNVGTLNKQKVEWLKQGKLIQHNINVCPFCGQIISDKSKEKLVDHYDGITYLENENTRQSNREIDSIIYELEKCFDDVQDTYREQRLQVIVSDLKRKLEIKKDCLDSKINYSGFDGDIKKIKREYRLLQSKVRVLEQSRDVFNIKDIFNLDSQIIDKQQYKKALKRINSLYINITQLSDSLNEKFNMMYKTNCKIKAGIDEVLTEQNNKIFANKDFINKELKRHSFKYSIDVDCANIGQKILKKTNIPQLKLFLIPINYAGIKQEFNKEEIKSILSEGEKSILAWVLFYSDLVNNHTSNKHFILIDDPISSYDAYRRFNLVHELKQIIKKSFQHELMILSHEKSFVNSMKNIEKLKFYNVIDGEVVATDYSSICESDLKNEIAYIANNSSISNNKELLLYIIRSRNIIEYNMKLMESLSKKRQRKLTSAYEEASKIIHLKKTSLSNDYNKCVMKTLKLFANKKINIEINPDIDVNNLNFESVVDNTIDDVYLARVRINKYLIEKLDENNINYNDKNTTGELLDEAKNVISSDVFENISMFLPIVNIYNHPNDSFGLRNIDCSEIRKNELFSFVNTL